MSNEPPLFATLEKPPQAISITVRALLQRFTAGGVRVPEFQRPLRWRIEDVLKLFDSVLRGYPVGSLLFWKREAPATEHLSIGGAYIKVPADPDAWWIIDGQQRITALVAALLDLDHGGDKRWRVYFDPSTHRFVGENERAQVLRDDAKQGKSTLLAPLPVLGDLRRLGRFLTTVDSDELQASLEATQQRILDHPLSAYLMETESPEPLRGVFARLNSTGVRMQADEVFQALLGARQGFSSRGRIDIQELQRACDLDGFGEPPRGEIVKAILAMSGHDPTRRLDQLDEADVAKLISGDDAKIALQKAVAFLQTFPDDLDEPGAGIPFYGFIPYPVVLVLLARWFHVFPNTTREARVSLGHWLWRAVRLGTHEKAAIPSLQRQVRLIKETMRPDEVLDTLLSAVKLPWTVRWSVGSFTSLSAHSRTEVLALLSLSPRDLDGPISWRALISQDRRAMREIVSRQQGVNLDESTKWLRTTAANLMLLDEKPPTLLRALRGTNGSKASEILEAHLIDDEAWGLYEEGDLDGFLDYRRNALAEHVNGFLRLRAGDRAPRLRSVESYFDTDPGLDDAAPAEENETPDETDFGNPPHLAREASR